MGVDLAGVRDILEDYLRQYKYESNHIRLSSLIKTVEGLAPVLPALVRFAGNVARSRLVTGSLSLTATLLTPVVKLTAPLTARLVVPSIGPSLKLVNAMAPALPAIIKVSDGIFRVEVAIERGFGGRGR